MLGISNAAAPPQVESAIPQVSELELIGLAALVYLAIHLFNSLIWPSLRELVRVVYCDLMNGFRRVKTDLRSLRE
jgi:hypothetical protein